MALPSSQPKAAERHGWGRREISASGGEARRHQGEAPGQGHGAAVVTGTSAPGLDVLGVRSPSHRRKASSTPERGGQQQRGRPDGGPTCGGRRSARRHGGRSLPSQATGPRRSTRGVGPVEVDHRRWADFAPAPGR